MGNPRTIQDSAGWAPENPAVSHLGVPREQNTKSASSGWMPARGTLLPEAVVSFGDSFPLLLPQRGCRPGLRGTTGVRKDLEGNGGGTR